MASVRPAPRTTITGRRGRRGRRSRPRRLESGTRSTRSSPTTIASPRGPDRTSSGRTSVTSCAALSGTAIRPSSTVIMRASETSSVSGRRSVKRVPSPTTLRTSTSPFRRRTFVRTTSRPTPRPAAVVTALAVLKPGRKTRSRAALSSSSAAAGAKPCSTACRRSRFGSMPRPSSATSTRTAPPSCAADSVTVPVASLPQAWRSSGVSMPWAIVFCTRWSSGSTICSMMEVSSSTASPRVSKRTVLRAARAASCPCRTNRPKRLPIGTRRARPISLRSAPVIRCTCAMSSRSARLTAVSSDCSSAMSAAISATVRAKIPASS